MIQFNGIGKNGEWFVIPSFVIYVGRSYVNNKVVFISFEIVWLNWRTGFTVYRGIR